MKANCKDCGEHKLNCQCPDGVDERIFDATKYAFFMFLVEAFDEFAPHVKNKLKYENIVDFVEEWVDENFND